MMIEENFDIRYVKLYFKAALLEDCELPANKASSLRGGMGEMLLRVNCVRDRECEYCDFQKECVVQRMMYSQFEMKPEFMSKGDSVGYILSCENYEKFFSEGDTFEFEIILFGKNIVYFNQYLQALYALGQQGIGKYNARFVITEVKNVHGKHILDENNIYMERYEIEQVSDYIARRRRQIQKEGLQNVIYFHTPLTLKYQGSFLQKFQMDAIVRAAQRRVYMLEAFEGNDVEEWYYSEYEIPELLHQKERSISVRRYSHRKEAAMFLKGIVGELRLDSIPERTLDLLLAGELLHIGKNTSFGFGRYIIR